MAVDGAEEEKKACDVEEKEDAPKIEKGESENAAQVEGEEKPEKRSCGVRLTYFDGAGRAELSRLILAAAGIEFEDRRIDAQDWKELKPGAWMQLTQS